MSVPDLFHINGVIPSLTVSGDVAPKRTESGIGALMPWADRLWLVSYVAHTRTSGGGTGLYEIRSDFTMHKHPESTVGTYANRMIHAPSHQLVIGPHLIDAEGRVRTFSDLVDHRLTATMEHLFDPERMVYFLTMEGLLIEADVFTMEINIVDDLLKALDIPKDARPHFKAGHTSQGRVVVANNTYEERDYLGTADDGRLAEWDGEKWTILERKPFVEVTGRRNMAQTIYATGWDRASVILKVLTRGTWRTYRLPKATQTHDNSVQTEWPRIREVESERYLLDIHGMFYELQPWAYNNHVWGVRPISTHLRIIPDFCSWRGMLVLGGNQVTPINDTNLLAGEPHAGLWFGKTDDLWHFGKPSGWGGPWWQEEVTPEQPSDPYLMTGFDQKCLHLRNHEKEATRIRVEVDFLGNEDWCGYDTFELKPNAYHYHTFPPGFSAHWVRLVSEEQSTITAYFTYT